jgi:hypothetical protein
VGEKQKKIAQKVMGGGKRAGETERNKIRTPRKFEKNSCRDFSTGKIIS